MSGLGPGEMAVITTEAFVHLRLKLTSKPELNQNNNRLLLHTVANTFFNLYEGFLKFCISDA